MAERKTAIKNSGGWMFRSQQPIRSTDQSLILFFQMTSKPDLEQQIYINRQEHHINTTGDIVLG